MGYVMHPTGRRYDIGFRKVVVQVKLSTHLPPLPPETLRRFFLWLVIRKFRLREGNEPLSAKKRYFLLTLVENMRDPSRVIGDKKLGSEFISKLNEFSSQ